MRVSKALLVATCAGALTLSAAARADEPDESTRVAARALGSAGVEAFQAGNFAAAGDRLEKAFSLLRVPSLGLWSARALVKRGLLVEGAERYLEVTGLQAPSGDTAIQQRAQADARTELAALKAVIPSVVVRLADAQPAEVAVWLDGKQLAASWIGQARLVNPGAHQAVAERGSEKATGSATVAEGESKTISLSFASAAKAVLPPAGGGAGSATDDRASGHSSTVHTLGWIALGAGAAGVVVGGITGFLAAGKKADLKDSGECIDDRCPTSQKGTVDSLNSLRTISSIGFIAGGVLAGTGIVLLLSSGSSHAGATQAFVTPTSFGLRQSF